MLKKLLKPKNKENNNNIDSLIQDSKECLASGHTEDAISILNNGIEKRSENDLSASSTTKLFEGLTDIYQQQNDKRMIKNTQLDLMNFVQREAPELANKIIPIKYELFKSGDFKPDADSISEIAELAYSRNEPDEAIKIVGKFAHEHPEHQDIGKNYFYVGKSLLSLGKPEQAYRLLTALVKKYPQDQKIPEIKSFILEIKNSFKK